MGISAPVCLGRWVSRRFSAPTSASAIIVRDEFGKLALDAIAENLWPHVDARAKYLYKARHKKSTTNRRAEASISGHAPEIDVNYRQVIAG